jgi:hypothetical protein
MVSIEDMMKSRDDKDDLAMQEAENALCMANEYDGGNIGDLAFLLKRASPDAVYEAIRRGWLMREGDVVHITTEGRDHYLTNLKESCRYPLDYSEPDAARVELNLIEAGLKHVIPVEHTIYAWQHPAGSRKIDDQ